MLFRSPVRPARSCRVLCVPPGGRARRAWARLAAGALAAFASATTYADTPAPAVEAPACVDFYGHVNARWLASTPIPPDRARWGVFDELAKRTRADLRTILEGAAATASAPDSATGKLLRFYRAGMDTAAIDAAGATPLAPELARIAAIRTPDDLVDVLARLHRMDVNAGFAFAITPDAEDSTRYLAELWQGGLGLPDRDYYFRTDAKSVSQRDLYAKHVARMLALLGEPADRAAAEARAIVALETELAGASLTAEARREPKAVTHKMDVDALAAAAPGVDWARYLGAVGVGRPERLNVGMPAFMTRFAALARSVPMSEWQAYLRWQLVHATATKLSATFEREHFAFYDAVLVGRKEMPPRDERVIDTITGRYGSAPLAMALGELYVRERFPPAAKARALALVENLRAALRTRIGELDWMGDATRKAALAKLDAMVLKIGYPDHWRDYRALDLSAPSYVGQWLAANAFETDRQIALLAKPVDRQEWFSSPQLVNAFYQPRMNAIVFPAAILQPPFFDPAGDDAMNYGAIGAIIGHEITHGFDNHGRQFDALGNLHDWWTAEDAGRYVQRADLVVRQYGAFEAQEGLKLNGGLTLSENIADIGGLKIAYLAFQRAGRQHPAVRVDDLSPEQRFFTAFARSWRAKTTPELERLLVNTDPHSPSRFRVDGVLANLPEFAQAFACRNTDPMVRGESERAAIW